MQSNHGINFLKNDLELRDVLGAELEDRKIRRSIIRANKSHYLDINYIEGLPCESSLQMFCDFNYLDSEDQIKNEINELKKKIQEISSVILALVNNHSQSFKGFILKIKELFSSDQLEILRIKIEEHNSCRKHFEFFRPSIEKIKEVVGLVSLENTEESIEDLIDPWKDFPEVEHSDEHSRILENAVKIFIIQDSLDFNEEEAFFKGLNGQKDSLQEFMNDKIENLSNLIRPSQASIKALTSVILRHII